MKRIRHCSIPSVVALAFGSIVAASAFGQPAQGGAYGPGMMGGSGYGWMGGFGGAWLPLLLVIAAAALVGWLIGKKGR